MKTFKYLGDKFKYDELSRRKAELELCIMLMLAEAKFYELLKKLTKHQINLTTSVLILHSLMRSRLTYSCQTWKLTERPSQRINSVYKNIPRKMIRGGLHTCVEENDFCYKISKKKLLEICHANNVTDFIRK